MADDGEAVIARGAASSTAADALALGGASRGKADAYLDEQLRFVRLQSENLIEQNAFELSHLRWRRFNDQMKGALEIILVAVAVLLAIALGAAIWSARQADGVVIEAFLVPPDMAQKGISGELIAGKVLDLLQTFQSQTQSSRAASAYANDWGNDIKVQIPNTGVSIGEINRYLRQWLGHETHISGEFYRTSTGMALTARVGSQPGQTFTGKEVDFDKLVQDAAESIYRVTQPYRYASYLSDHGRNREAAEVFNELAGTGSPRERAWGYVGLAALRGAAGDFEEAEKLLDQATTIQPDLLLAQINLTYRTDELGHYGKEVDAANKSLQLLKSGETSEVDPAHITALAFDQNLFLFYVRHDSPAIIAQTRARLEQPESDGTRDNDRETLLLACGAVHDRACVRRVNAALVDGRNPEKIVDYASTVQQAYSFLGAWDAVVTLGPAAEREYSSVAPPMWGRAMQIREVTPFMAEAAAHLGQFQKAHTLADRMPPDSSPCLVVRGEIRALEHKWAPAAFWFAKASTIGAPDPSIPTEWGRMLMMKRDYDGAIAKFSIANRKGPHFADPLEMWGEALIAKNRSDLALAKFEEANKYAPNWGRLHLKWGEALLWNGDKAAAQKQFALAARLDLTPSEKNLLAKVGAHG